MLHCVRSETKRREGAGLGVGYAGVNGCFRAPLQLSERLAEGLIPCP